MPKVTLKNTGETVEVTKGANLLAVSEKNGWPISNGCGTGFCGACMVKIIDGIQNVNPVTETEKGTLEAMSMNDGTKRLACQVIINGDVTIQAM